MTQTDTEISPFATDNREPTCVLYVGGLSNMTSDQEFHSMLAAFGTIEQATLVRHKHTRQSAGFGFVHMYSRAEALNAIRTLDGTHHNGQRLRLFCPERPPSNRSRS